MPDLPILALASGFIFLAAIVRGYSGFGFSLLSITALSLILTPAQVIPAIFLLEVAASLHLLPSIWKDVHWGSLTFLMLGALIGTPIGVYALANVPQAQMTLALACFVLLATFLLWRGFSLKTMPSRPATLAVGTATGLANGAFGMGGPPVVLFYFASPAGFSAPGLAPPPPLLAPAMPGRLVVKVLSTKDLIVSFNTFGALNTA